jgi:hypothetical protein
MASVEMTIHTFDHSYAGFPVPEVEFSSCRHFFLPARRPRTLFINGTGNRQLRTLCGKRQRELWQQAVAICGNEEAAIVDLHGHRSTRRISSGTFPISTSTR